MKRMLFLLPVFAASAAMAAPTVSDVAFVQDAATRRVTVSYKLDAPAVVTLDVQVRDGDAFKSIGGDKYRHLSGAVNQLVSAVGTVQQLFWQPDDTFRLAQNLAAGDIRFVVTAWDPASPPEYVVFDMTKIDVTRFYPNEGSLPFPITDDRYKTSLMVMRRIPAAGVKWWMGAASNEPGYNADLEARHQVTIAADYYIGVYEFTVSQWRRTNSTGTFSSTVDGRRPAYGLPFSWFYSDDDSVSSESQLQKIRTFFGNRAFAFPTAAEWEFACRAGTGSAMYDGRDCSAENAKELGWVENSISSSTVVGLKPANRFGLYDMCGNVAEWVMDKYGTDRSVRGGGYTSWAGQCRSGAILTRPSTANYSSIGFRLKLPISEAVK